MRCALHRVAPDSGRMLRRLVPTASGDPMCNCTGLTLNRVNPLHAVSDDAMCRSWSSAHRIGESKCFVGVLGW